MVVAWMSFLPPHSPSLCTSVTVKSIQAPVYQRTLKNYYVDLELFSVWNNFGSFLSSCQLISMFREIYNVTEYFAVMVFDEFIEYTIPCIIYTPRNIGIVRCHLPINAFHRRRWGGRAQIIYWFCDTRSECEYEIIHMLYQCLHRNVIERLPFSYVKIGFISDSVQFREKSITPHKCQPNPHSTMPFIDLGLLRNHNLFESTTFFHRIHSHNTRENITARINIEQSLFVWLNSNFNYMTTEHSNSEREKVGTIKMATTKTQQCRFGGSSGLKTFLRTQLLENRFYLVVMLSLCGMCSTSIFLRFQLVARGPGATTSFASALVLGCNAYAFSVHSFFRNRIFDVLSPRPDIHLFVWIMKCSIFD